ncbi:MAG: hypothetical protein EON50_06240 [Acidovorax sp.]|nr:MAG: hypothetical protein EON50_06240 [Acidovorax sp.]
MLQEMGVTVWSPPEAAEVAPLRAGSTAAAQAAPVGAALAPPTQVTAAVPQPVSPAAAPVAAGARAPAQPPAPAAGAATGATAAAPALRMHPAQALYAQADPGKTPTELGAGWLIVTESTTPADPLSGDAGKLLDNMLRAMQLHKHPRVFVAALERAPAGTAGTAGAAGSDSIPDDLAAIVAQLQPAMVLVLGHVAARAALGRTEPLGRLRAELHQLAGCPAVVTYDPAFLLRSQDVKAAAWADLCRALATVRARKRG